MLLTEDGARVDAARRRELIRSAWAGGAADLQLARQTVQTASRLGAALMANVARLIGSARCYVLRRTRAACA
jgi:hypothetical protein